MAYILARSRVYPVQYEPLLIRNSYGTSRGVSNWAMELITDFLAGNRSLLGRLSENLAESQNVIYNYCTHRQFIFELERFGLQ